jgi:glycosyltransferase involved in cell wall biosynthesis
MINDRTLVAGVNYPGVKFFLSEYINSIDNQTDTNFDLLIVNDGITEETKNKFGKVKWVNISQKTSPASIRQFIYNYAKNNKYNNLIFSDTDDFFSENRIEIAKDLLKKYDFVCNDITLINNKSEVLKDSFLSEYFNDKEISSVDLLLDKNLIGLGNSAIRLNNNLKIEIPGKIIAADWYLYSVLLLNNSKGVFTESTITYYRQYDENLIGIIKKVDEQILERSLNVKMLHYEELKRYCKKIKSSYESIYAQKWNDLAELKTALHNEKLRLRYINTINANFNKIYNGWWSEILTLKQIEKYENQFL